MATTKSIYFSTIIKTSHRAKLYSIRLDENEPQWVTVFLDTYFPIYFNDLFKGG